MVIVDSSVWIDYFGGGETAESRWLDAESGSQRLGLVDLSLCEVLQGARDDRDFRATREELWKFEIFATGGREFAVQVANNFCKLRRKGITIRRMTDCWIATFCIRDGHSLLHRDRDFDAFEKELGLRVVKP